jgi:hypothetical protein
MRNHALNVCLSIAMLSGGAMAQYGGGTTGGTSGGGATTGAASGTPTTSGFGGGNLHINFNRPESWALKYFASASLLSGLQPPEPTEGRHFGALTIGLELGWVPQLDAGQRNVGFNGKVPEDLNKAPIFARPVIRIGLPWKFTAIVAGPPPFELFGVTPHLFAFGLERPIVERPRWMAGIRGYGQLGSVTGAFTCPQSVLSFAPGSPDNPTRCTGESKDEASLRYAGAELQFAYRPRSMPKLVPHAASGINYIDGVFQVNAPLTSGMDHTRLWTRGKTFSESAGISYMVTKHAAFTVDMFYTPLWVRRSANAPLTNDGLFNVRALLSYSFR